MRTDRRLITRLLGALLALAALPGAAPAPGALELGRRLYHGESTLQARMVSHAEALPQEAVRCTNCHQREAEPALPNTENFGPRLGPLGLTKPVVRRGGPASRYDAKALCRLLRDGIDPAHVMIPQTMPRYTMTDQECEALWTFLTSP